MTYTVWFETETHNCMRTFNHGELTNFKIEAKRRGWKIKSIDYIKNGSVVKTVKFN